MKNLKKFLDLIAWAEGTSRLGKQNGYDVVVGGSLFTDFSKHPNKLIEVRKGLKSTAAGRYQILKRYADHYCKQLKLKDFSPASQDAIAIQMIKEQGALGDIEAGRIEEAIVKCRNIWASLPGNSYGQPQKEMAALLEKYKSLA